MKSKFNLVLALVVAIGLLVLFSVIGQYTSTIAAPLEQQTVTQVWFNQTVATTGTTAVIETGSAQTWAAFLHVDAPVGADDSYTITVGGRAIIGTTVYTTTDPFSYAEHEFSVAQNHVISTTYSGGLMWPQHYVTVNGRRDNLTADLIFIIK